MSLAGFAAETKIWSELFGLEDELPVIRFTRLDLSPQRERVVLAVGLGVRVGFFWYEYAGPIPKAELEAFEAQMERYAESFC